LKYRDPLHVLIEYITEVRPEDLGYTLVILILATQRANKCDMVLVHDDDLIRVRGNLQSNALIDYLQRSEPEIQHVPYGQSLPITTSEFLIAELFIPLVDCPSANEGDNSRLTVTVAVLSDGFRKRDLTCQEIPSMRKITVYSNHVEVKLNPETVHQYDGVYLSSPHKNT
jgi:hypothetical protein